MMEDTNHSLKWAWCVCYVRIYLYKTTEQKGYAQRNTLESMIFLIFHLGFLSLPNILLCSEMNE